MENQLLFKQMLIIINGTLDYWNIGMKRRTVVRLLNRASP